MFCRKNKSVNVLKLAGVIHTTGRKNLCFSNIKANIDKAFKSKPKAVALLINSPGGSPVQSEMIANYIVEKSTATKVPVITFVEDVAASGGYWLALAGEQIYSLSKSSIVGSLGVVYASFGFNKLIAQYGIDRRVHTAGNKKVSLDVFQEEKPEDIARLKNMLADVHEHFKEWVIGRRENKITLAKEDLFSGEFWTANQGLKHGLIDGIADLEPKLQELYGKKIKINYINLVPKKSLFSLFSSQSNLDIVDDVVSKLKSELLWNKYGL
ncbi:S49 family peptidase [Candidatus Hepatincola sp. Av]